LLWRVAFLERRKLLLVNEAKPMTRRTIWLAGLLLLLALPAHATVPGTLLVEGTLANSGGAPVADGTYSITFALYPDAATPTPLWVEGPTQVSVKGGGFSQLLGASTPLTSTLLAAGSQPMLALKVGGDPELPRKPIASVPFALRAGVAENLECTGCVTATALSKSVFDAINAASNLAKVASTGAYSDLVGTPVLVAAAQSCGVGQAISGIDALGKVVCASGAGVGNDPLSYVSNGALVNVFPTVTTGNSNIAIPDNNATGVSDTITIANGASIATLSITVNISNSDISHLTVNLIAPDKSVIVLFNKNGFAGGNIATSFPDPTPVFSGDLGGWSGKSAKGAWQIQLIDSAMQNGGATYDGKLLSWSISLGYASANKVQANGDFTVAGNLTVNGTNNLLPTGAIMAFSTASCPVGWLPANGNNGTPNLQGRMPIGVGALPYGGSSITYGQTGGTNKWRISVGVSNATKCSGGSTYCSGSFSYLYGATMDFLTNSGTGSYTNDNSSGAYLDLMPPYIGVYWCVKQ
jgi:subtilisin-like proprotein convertase family protein